MGTTYDKAFDAAVGSIQQSTAVPLSAFKVQAKIAQATTINSSNAALAAIKDQQALSEKAGNNADIIELETSKQVNATAVEVADMAKQGYQAVQVGRDALVHESLAAIEAQKELSTIQENKPNGFAHPIRWVADTLHANKLEAAIQDHSEAVQTYAANINNVVTTTTNQVDEMLSTQNLLTSASMRARAVELKAGMNAQQAVVTGEAASAGVLTKTGDTILSQSQAVANWVQSDQRLQVDLEQARVSGEANRIRLLEMQREAEANKYKDGAIKQAAQFWLTQQNNGKGLPPTVTNMNTAMEHMTKLQALPDNSEFALYSKAGGFAINSADPVSATTAALHGMTVGEAVQLGNLTKNSGLAALGGNQVNQLTQTNEAALRKSSYMATLLAGKEFTQAGFDIWAGSLKAPQNASIKARAKAMAENVVYNQSTQQFSNGRANGRDIGQGAFNMGAFKSPAALVNTFGVSPEAARVLADPKSQLFISNRASSEPTDKKTAQLLAIMEVLEKNKIANPSGAAALIGNKIGKSTVDTDVELQTLGKYGIVSSGAGVISYNGERYKLDNPIDLDKMRLAASKKDSGSLFSSASGFLGTVSEVSGFDNFLADKAQKQAALKKSQALPEQAALAASQYTPAGHAPQVSGGVPATALTEAEKLQNLAGISQPLPADLQTAAPPSIQVVQQFQQTQEVAGKQSKQAELDAVNKAIGLGNLPTATSPLDTPTEVKVAVKEGSLPAAQAKPFIKAKIQEAKQAGDVEAVVKWDSLLDLVTPAQQKKQEGSLSLDLRK